MELVLEQKQTLNLVMTTELRQAIQLLQYSTYELYQFIQEQQEENPLIELEEPFSYSYTSHRKNQDAQDSGEFPPNPIDFTADRSKSFYDDLLEQVNCRPLHDEQYKLVHYLIQNLDRNGYLQVADEEVMTHFSIDERAFNDALRVLQQLEPIGVGARSLSECLAIQIRHYYEDEALALKLVESDLDALAQKQWEKLANKYAVSLKDIQKAFDIIQTLEPKPCLALSDGHSQYIEPDIVIKEENGEFKVQLNESYLPSIRLNSDYAPLVKQTKKRSSYIQNQYKKLQWLRNSIEQRRQTILKITKVLIHHQRPFFEKGFSALQPLTLKDVADEIDMHESTVSRATTNKFIQTSQGTFDMRRLFSTRLNRSRGEDVSQERVKMILKETIADEDKAKPLSDQKIADYLKEEKNITISRRTVAKYRGELNIPSSRQRRRIITT